MKAKLTYTEQARQFKKKYGSRAIEVAARMRNLAKTVAQQTHWSKVIRALEIAPWRGKVTENPKRIALFARAGSVRKTKNNPKYTQSLPRKKSVRDLSRAYWIIESHPKGSFELNRRKDLYSEDAIKKEAQKYADKYGVQASVRSIYL